MSEKIMLIDGNSIINRAFYAIPLLSVGGVYTNGVYGFLNIFFKLLDEENPDYIAIAFDLKAPTFRHKMYAEYKGTRKGMPQELAEQMPVLKELLGKMNIKIYEKEGYEADDILGTLSKRADEKGIEPVVVSGDRDLLQLATDTIKIRIPKTKGGKTEIEDYYSKDVLEKYGVTPVEFIDVKALMGDASDNIPGIPSIGEKTAVKIIQEYKNIENAIENAGNIKPKKASENLITYKEQGLLSKVLATINVDSPIDFDVEDTRINNMFNEGAYEMFKSLNFKSFLNRFEIKTEDRSFEYSLEENTNIINPFEEVSYAIIREDNSLFGVAFSNNEGNFFIKNSDIEKFRHFFESDIPKICHNGKRDITYLRKYNIELKNIIFDTMIAGYILDSTKDSYEYNDISADFLGESYKSDEEIFGKGKSKVSIFSLPEDNLIKYGVNNSNVFFRAKTVMENKMKENNQLNLFYDIEMPLIYVLADMEKEGIRVDKEKLIAYNKDIEREIDELTKEIYFLAGEEFNINSPKQLGVILFEKLGLKGGKKTKTGWSTAADVLEKLRGKDEIADKVLKYRTYAKLKSTYAEGLLNVLDEKTSRIYSTFNQEITATGRISSTEPNLQNIPIRIEIGRQLRKVFIPQEDYIFIDGDYSQIELRVLAHLSGDETLINAFKEGQDIHRLTASQVFNTDFDEVTSEQRSKAKAVNFGIIYGISSFSLSQDIGVSKKEADTYIEGYFTKYPKIKEYLNNLVNIAKEKGYSETLYNRRRNLPEINSSNFITRSFGERVSMNMPIQGTAADIIKIAMVNVHREIKKRNLKSRLILQVHDELLIEAHKDEADIVKGILVEQMANCIILSVPLEVDIHQGNNWYEAK